MTLRTDSPEGKALLPKSIVVWPATCPGEDLRTHFWWCPEDHYERFCDGQVWPSDLPLLTDETSPYSPCLDCLAMYVDDMVHGEGRLVVELWP